MRIWNPFIIFSKPQFSGLVKKIPTPDLWNASSELFSKPSALMIHGEPLDHSSMIFLTGAQNPMQL
jgi:hypothetical protein